MATWEPVDIYRDDMGQEYDKWNYDFVNDLEIRFNRPRGFNKTLNESIDENTIEMTEKNKYTLKYDTIELVANQIYDKLITMFNKARERLGIENGTPIEELVIKYDRFKLADDGSLTFIYKRTVIDLGNINNRIKSPSELRRLSISKLKAMGFTDITDEDTHPYRTKYKTAREKVEKLDENLDKRSKAIESSSTTNTEAIEMIEVTSKDIDTTVKDVEQDTSFIEPSKRDNLLPLRELEGLDKQLRTIKGSLKVAIAKRVDLKSRIELEERKLSEVQDPKYSDDQISMIEDRLRKLWRSTD